MYAIPNDIIPYERYQLCFDSIPKPEQHEEILELPIRRVSDISLSKWDKHAFESQELRIYQ